ncbi:uncharacterized protein LOC106606048 [Lates japonicus]
MNVLLSLSLCFVLLLLTYCGNVGGQEEEDDYYDATPTPDYDYNATFEYYYVTGEAGVYVENNKAAGIGGLTLVLLLGLAVHWIWN